MNYSYDNEHNFELKILNDRNAHLKFLFCSFQYNVTISDCVIKEMDIDATHFFGGLVLENCIIEADAKFTSSSQNKLPIVIRNCEFMEFVDFEDCAFESELVLENVIFTKGTNLLGNRNTPVEVAFRAAPKISNVSGNLKLDTFKSEIE